MLSVVPEAVLHEFLARNGLVGTVLEYLGGSENAVWALRAGSARHIVRVMPVRRRRLDELEGEVEWLAHLAQHTLPIARVHPLGGVPVHALAYSGGACWVMLFDHVYGDALAQASLTPDILFSWGALLASLHEAAREFSPSRGRRPDWSEVTNFAGLRYLTGMQRHRFGVLLAQLLKLPRTASTYGLIHADLTLDNLISTRTGLVAIDFDDAVYCWFQYDLAIARAELNEAARRHDAHSSAEVLMECLLDGYRSVRSLPQDYQAHASLFDGLVSFEREITHHRLAGSAARPRPAFLKEVAQAHLGGTR